VRASAGPDRSRGVERVDRLDEPPLAGVAAGTRDITCSFEISSADGRRTQQINQTLVPGHVLRRRDQLRSYRW
jgi:hypothetical protein